MKNIILLTLISIFTLGCSKEDNEYAQYINSNSISSDIEFQVIEPYSKQTGIVEQPILKLRLKTIEEFGCYNNSIITTEFNNENSLIIRLEEIFRPFICLDAIGPAVSEIEIPENANKLCFLNGDNVDIYSIVINSQEVDISVIENSFTNSLFDKTYRYPENSFAFVCGTNTDNTYIYDDFLNLLINNQSLTEVEFGNSGRIPFPQITSGKPVNHPSRYFAYTDVSDFEN